MSKKGKYAFWNGDSYTSVSELQNRTKQNYINKYFNLWMTKFRWKGLDEELAAQQENFIMRKFWSDGQIAAKPIKNSELMVYAPWTLTEINCYDLPEKVTLINVHNAPFIPYEPQVVNKDVVIGWCQPNHKPISTVVQYYVDRLVQIDMVINTNLQLQKMPYLIGIDNSDKDTMQDIVERIINNETVVFASLEELKNVQTLATTTPYIIDKLTETKRSVEQELMTFLGMDNNGTSNLEQTHVVSDAVNANNDVINDYSNAIESEINKWIDQVNRVFNRQLAIECVSKPVSSVHESEDGGMEDEPDQN